MRTPLSLWKSLPPNRKLYFVVGTMGVLIACELFVLTAAIEKVSSVRAFVEGEAHWSKAQKNALIALKTFPRTRDERFYREFLDELEVPEGDHKARLELMKANPNLALVREGFIEGRIDPADIDNVINLLRRYYWLSYVSSATADWAKGDELLGKLRATASDLHMAVLSGDQAKSLRLMDEINGLNAQLTPLEDHFSQVLSDGSRWLEAKVMTVLLCIVIIVEATGLSLTIFTGREIAAVADENARLFSDATESVKIRDEFISIASHELKTPLTSLILQLYDLAETANGLGPEKQFDRLKGLSEKSLLSADRLAGLVDDLLDMTKIRLGRLQLNKEVCDLVTIVQEAIHQLQPEASKQGSEMDLESPKAIVGMFDRRRIFQVALNLISNAIKYGDGKPISVRLRQNGEKAFLVVQDQGKGISFEHLPKLFNPYERLAHRTETSGLGLGLHIANELVKNHGGSLSAASVPDHGATFTVELPIGV